VRGTWVSRWSALADDAALGPGAILGAATGSGVPAADVAAQAKTAWEDFLAGLLETASEDGTVPAS
jgi:hypothetical protein